MQFIQVFLQLSPKYCSNCNKQVRFKKISAKNIQVYNKPNFNENICNYYISLVSSSRIETSVSDYNFQNLQQGCFE